MAIQNRDMAPPQACVEYHKTLGATATGVTTLVGLVPYQAQVVAAGIKIFGLSGAPVYSLNLLRTVAAGLTSIGLGATVTPPDGATYVTGFSITLGATVPVQAGDIVMINSGVANTAITGGQLTVVLKPLQDVKTFFGSQVS